jgi:hypothetical protein
MQKASEHIMSTEPQTYDPRQRRGRRQRKGNSENFNYLQSAALELSVNEQVRLIRSLAGQRGLVVLSTDQVSRLKGNAPQIGSAAGQEKEPQAPVRHNPLKGTVFEKELNEAKAAIKKAKEMGGNKDLVPDHPAVLAFKAKLVAYKSEQLRLAPVPGSEIQSTIQPKKRVRQLSPAPNEGRAKSSFLGSLMSGRASNSKKPVTSSSSQSGTVGGGDHEML